MGKEGGAPSISSSGPSIGTGRAGPSFSPNSVSSPRFESSTNFSRPTFSNTRVSRSDASRALFSYPKLDAVKAPSLNGKLPRGDNPFKGNWKIEAQAPRPRPTSLQRVSWVHPAPTEVGPRSIFKYPKLEAVKATSPDGPLPKNDNPFGKGWSIVAQSPVDRFRAPESGRSGGLGTKVPRTENPFSKDWQIIRPKPPVTNPVVEAQTTTGINALDRIIGSSEKPINANPKGIFGARVEYKQAFDQAVGKPKPRTEVSKGIEGAKLYGERRNPSYSRVVTERVAKAAKPTTGSEIWIPKPGVASVHRALKSVEGVRTNYDRPLVDIALGKPAAKPRVEGKKGIEWAKLYGERRNPGYAKIVTERSARAAESQILSKAESPDTKPAVLKPEKRNVQVLAELISEKAQNYARNINTQRVIEAAELAHATYKIKAEGMSAESSQILVQAAVLKGIEVAQPEKLAEKIKSSPKWEGVKKAVEKAKARVKGEVKPQNKNQVDPAEAQPKGTWRGQPIPKAEKMTQAKRLELTYQKIKTSPDTKKVIQNVATLYKQGLTVEQIQTQVVQEMAQSELTENELETVTSVLLNKIDQAKTEVGNDEEPKKNPKEPFGEIKKDRIVAELDPKAQAARFELLAEAIAKAPEKDAGWVDSTDITKKLPRQADQPEVISEARYWYHLFMGYDPDPDGSWPQSLKEMEESWTHENKTTAWRRFSDILDENIPIRWRPKNKQSQREATQKQIDLVYDHIADGVAREVAISLAA